MALLNFDGTGILWYSNKNESVCSEQSPERAECRKEDFCEMRRMQRTRRRRFRPIRFLCCMCAVTLLTGIVLAEDAPIATVAPVTEMQETPSDHIIILPDPQQETTVLDSILDMIPGGQKSDIENTDADQSDADRDDADQDSRDRDDADQSGRDKDDSDQSSSDKEDSRKPGKSGKGVSVDTSDLLFVGNSLIDGIRIMTGETCLCEVGISLEGLKSEIYGQMRKYSCNNVVIEMGTNEMGVYDRERFMDEYQDLIDHIRDINEDAVIVCMSIPPVTAKEDATSEFFKNKFVRACNGYIQELCEENDLIYLDNTPFFGDVLDMDISDGAIHLKSNEYVEWHDYIIETLEDMG